MCVKGLWEQDQDPGNLKLVNESGVGTNVGPCMALHWPKTLPRDCADLYLPSTNRIALNIVIYCFPFFV